jgi:hypothetical protein
LSRKSNDFVPIFNGFTPKICGKGRSFRAYARSERTAARKTRLGDVTWATPSPAAFAN